MLIERERLKPSLSPQLRNSLSHHQTLTVNVLQGLDRLLGLLQSLLNPLSLGLDRIAELVKDTGLVIKVCLKELAFPLIQPFERSLIFANASVEQASFAGGMPFLQITDQ